MRCFPALLVLVFTAGCQCSPQGRECPAAAFRPQCCEGGCNGDVRASAVCDTDTGTWICPPASASSDQCPAPFCAGGGVLTPPCPKQLGVCNGSLATRLPDGRLQCGPAEYGPHYQDRETRCDGLDNDCDSAADRWWSTVFSYANPYGEYPFDVIETDGGFLYAIADPGGAPLLRYTNRLLQQARPDVPIAGWDAGRAVALRLVRTADGITLGMTGPVPAAFDALLDADGLPLPRALIETPLPFSGAAEEVAATPDGTQVLHVLWGIPPTSIVAYTQDSQGNAVAGPTEVMALRFAIPGELHAARAVGLGPGAFVLAAAEEGSPQYGLPAYLRVQPISASLSPLGEERVFQGWTQLYLDLLDANGLQVPLVYVDHPFDPIRNRYPPQVHVIPDALDAGADAGETWVRYPGEWLNFDAARSAQGIELAWRRTDRCVTCPSSGVLWTTWEESAPDSGVNLNPGGGAAFFSELDRAGDLFLRRGPPGTWVAFLPDHQLDGGNDLRAVTYCKP